MTPVFPRWDSIPDEVQFSTLFCKFKGVLPECLMGFTVRTRWFPKKTQHQKRPKHSDAHFPRLYDRSGSRFHLVASGFIKPANLWDPHSANSWWKLYQYGRSAFKTQVFCGRELYLRFRWQPSQNVVAFCVLFTAPTACRIFIIEFAFKLIDVCLILMHSVGGVPNIQPVTLAQCAFLVEVVYNCTRLSRVARL